MLNLCNRIIDFFRRWREHLRVLAILAALAWCGFVIFHIGAATYSTYPKREHENQANRCAKNCAPQEPPLSGWWDWTTHDPVAFYTSVLSVFTGLLFFSTVGLWLATQKGLRIQIGDTRVTQRAYVRISHRTTLSSANPKGHPAIFDFKGQASIEIEIRNHGQTPAKITATYIGHAIVRSMADLPEKPIYDPGRVRSRGTFLVKDDFFGTFDSLGVQFASLPSIGGAILVVYGFVDYIDVFGVRYRGGYARQYAPQVRHPNNLVFLDHPGYEFDRCRTRDEGIDWDEET